MKSYIIKELYIKEDFDYKSKNPKLCAYGKYRGYDFLVIYIGMHPCAYIRTNEKLYNALLYTNNDNCPAHGNFTFHGILSRWRNKFKDVIDTAILDKYYLGWDFGHWDDYSYSDYRDSALCSTQNMKHKWTTDEIIENIKQVIDWIIAKETKSNEKKN